MSRYIDADKIVITAERGISDDGLIFIPMIDVHRSIDATPTADVVEVRHGEWKYGKENGQYGYYCTICKACFVGENAEWIAKEHNFCPKCGAKMDGERSENES